MFIDMEKYENVLNENDKRCYERNEERNPIQEFSFTVNIEPVPFARPRNSRFVKVGHYNPRAKYYTKLKKLYKEAIGDKFKDQLIEGPVELRSDFYITPPKYIKESLRKSNFAQAGIYLPAVMPDLDNFEKASTDCLEKYCMKNDSQIVASSSRKFYAIDREPGIDITLRYRLNKIDFR